MVRITCLISVIFIFFVCCRSREATQQGSVSGVPKIDSGSLHSSAKDSISVSAYLIYTDGSQSEFDILKDKKLVLWNTIIGEGDALKASSQTKVVCRQGNGDLVVQIINGKKKVIDTVVDINKSDFKYTIMNTGCNTVYIKLSSKKYKPFFDSIPFRCGE